MRSASVILAALMTALTAAADLMPDTWAATDGLGRSLPLFDETGAPRTNRTVAVLYSAWHEDLFHDNRFADGPFDLTRILKADPKAMDRADSAGLGPWNAPHHWGEPLYGYYLSDDPFVCRRHAQMLSDAGVDVLIFDVTNGHTHEKGVVAMCEALLAAEKGGAAVPRIAFFCPLSAVLPTRNPALATTVRRIWELIYKPRRYETLWFKWKGKPLILAHPCYCDAAGCDTQEAREMRAFFTFRGPVTGTRLLKRPEGGVWAWIDAHPQWLYTDETGEVEMTAVSVAQNCMPDRSIGCMSSGRVRGRCWHGGANDPRPGAVNLGFNFQEQWDHALKTDPPLLFIVGWNEWRALRLRKWNGFEHPGGVFVDQFNAEFSRDCEPVKGEWGDAYYWQLVANIRRYKGVRPVPNVVSRPIAIDGRFDDWREVEPAFRDAAGDPARRDWRGWGTRLRYTDDSGRNDIILAKVSRSGGAICFYMRTAEPMTVPEGDGANDWMRLLIDIDRDASTGWLGYDFIIERDAAADRRATPPAVLRAHDPKSPLGVFAWSKPVAEVEAAISGCEMELSVPETAFGGRLLPEGFDFKWEDNALQSHDWTDFTCHGDAAPNDRYNYRARFPSP